MGLGKVSCSWQVSASWKLLPFSPLSTWLRFGRWAGDLTASEQRQLMVPLPASVASCADFFQPERPAGACPELTGKPRSPGCPHSFESILFPHLAFSVPPCFFLPLEQKQFTPGLYFSLIFTYHVFHIFISCLKGYWGAPICVSLGLWFTLLFNSTTGHGVCVPVLGMTFTVHFLIMNYYLGSRVSGAC